jgi:hypothetical protein
MPDSDPEATPIAPAPASESPSSTGVVDGDEREPKEAPHSPDEGDC